MPGAAACGRPAAGTLRGHPRPAAAAQPGARERALGDQRWSLGHQPGAQRLAEVHARSRYGRSGHRHPFGERHQCSGAAPGRFAQSFGAARSRAACPVAEPVAGGRVSAARGVCFHQRRELLALLPFVHRACHLLHCSRSHPGPRPPVPAARPEREAKSPRSTLAGRGWLCPGRPKKVPRPLISLVRVEREPARGPGRSGVTRLNERGAPGVTETVARARSRRADPLRATAHAERRVHRRPAVTGGWHSRDHLASAR